MGRREHHRIPKAGRVHWPTGPKSERDVLAEIGRKSIFRSGGKVADKPAKPAAVPSPAQPKEQAQPEVQQGTVSVDDLFAQIGRGVMEKEVMQRNVNQRNGMIFQLQKELKAKAEAFDALQKSYDALIARLEAEANSVPGEGQNEAPSVEEAKTETQAALDAIPFKRNENT